MVDYDHIKDVKSGRIFEIKYINHKTNVEAYTWVNGNKVTKFGTDVETVYWAMEQAITQELHFGTGLKKIQD